MLEYGVASHKGKVRKSNEDYYYIPQEGRTTAIAMVADGMGGHNAGEKASRMAVEAIIELATEESDTIIKEPLKFIEESIKASNNKIFSFSTNNEEYTGMGTTLVLALFHKDNVYIGHVGDSRGYLIRNGEAIQLTKDHSLVQELLDNGSITLDEVEGHPQKNIITRALGTDERVENDCYELTLQADDIIVLCTDGLILHVDLQKEIKLFQSIESMQELASILVEQALERGGLDNITVVAAKYSGMLKEAQSLAR
ncbi:MAG TPA: Stp1/IreP family PP2C-type Ser/Thr phosphatase [Clostridia bacterium]|nr:Stp1/IreP family PP2C-type Ser/Thr phosphatase [Clostridia bacterium]